MSQPAESIRRRYFSKVSGNLTVGLFSFLNQGLLTRFLGPAAYGQLSFLQSHFELMFTSLDLGSSMSLFTRLSQDRGHYRTYTTLIALVTAAVTLVIGLYAFTVWGVSWSDYFWPQIPVSLIGWGVILGLGLYLVKISNYITDAAGVAQRVEVFRVLRAVGCFAVLAALALADSLSVAGALAVLGFSQLALSITCFRYGRSRYQFEKKPVTWVELKNTFSDSFRYGLPLVGYTLSTLLFGLLDRWLLQASSGSTQQGYYGIAYQLSLAISLITMAISPVMHRETAHAFATDTLTRIRKMYAETARVFVAFAAAGSLFLALNSREVLVLLSGESFAEGWAGFAIMSLYPVHQALNAIAVAVQLGTNRTFSFAAIGIARDSLGFLLCYALLASPTWFIPGLQLGALGLALKMVIAQFIATEIADWTNCRMLGISFPRRLFLDLILFAKLALTIALIRWGILSLPFTAQSAVLTICLEAIVYLFVLIGLIRFFPAVFGLSTETMQTALSILRSARHGLKQ